MKLPPTVPTLVLSRCKIVGQDGILRGGWQPPQGRLTIDRRLSTCPTSLTRPIPGPPARLHGTESGKLTATITPHRENDRGARRSWPGLL